MPASALTVLRIFDLDPGSMPLTSMIRLILFFRYDPFKVNLAHFMEQPNTLAIEMGRVENSGREFRNDLFQLLLTFDERPFSKILSVQPRYQTTLFHSPIQQVQIREIH